MGCTEDPLQDGWIETHRAMQRTFFRCMERHTDKQRVYVGAHSTQTSVQKYSPGVQIVM